MDLHTPTIATAIQSTAERYLTQHCHFHQMLLVVSVRPVLGHTCQRSLQYIALKVYFGSPALRQYPAFLCRCVHIIFFDTALKCRGAGCTSVQGAPCWSDNTLLSGTFPQSASPSGSPAPSYIHLLHFQREKRLKKSKGKEENKIEKKHFLSMLQRPSTLLSAKGKA